MYFWRPFGYFFMKCLFKSFALKVVSFFLLVCGILYMFWTPVLYWMYVWQISSPTVWCLDEQKFLMKSNSSIVPFMVCAVRVLLQKSFPVLKGTKIFSLVILWKFQCSVFPIYVYAPSSTQFCDWYEIGAKGHWFFHVDCQVSSTILKRQSFFLCLTVVSFA